MTEWCFFAIRSYPVFERWYPYPIRFLFWLKSYYPCPKTIQKFIRDDHGAEVTEWTPAGVCILGWSKSRSQYFRFEPVSSEISDLRNFWLHTMYACTEQYSTYQIRWYSWSL